MDQKIILELDRKVADQQSTLEKAGVAGFYVTTNPQVSVLGLPWHSLGDANPQRPDPSGVLGLVAQAVAGCDWGWGGLGCSAPGRVSVQRSAWRLDPPPLPTGAGALLTASSSMVPVGPPSAFIICVHQASGRLWPGSLPGTL